MNDSKWLGRISVGAFLIYLPLQLLAPLANAADECRGIGSSTTANIAQIFAALGSLGAILAAVGVAKHQAEHSLQMQRDGAADAIDLRAQAIQHLVTVAEGVIWAFEEESAGAIARLGHSRQSFQVQGVGELKAGAEALKSFPLATLSCGAEHVSWMCAIGDGQELAGRLNAQVTNGALVDPVVPRLLTGLRASVVQISALATLKRQGKPLVLDQSLRELVLR